VVEETKLIATWLFQKTPNTRIAYETDLKLFFKHYSSKTLKEITTAHLVVYFKQNPEFSLATKARKKAALSSLFKFLVKKRYLEVNPADAMDPIKVPDQTHFRVLDISEVKRMIQLEPSPRNKFFIKLLFKCGLRVSEAVTLTRENFKKRGEKYLLILTGKGGFTRTIVIQKKYYDEAFELSAVETSEKESENYIFSGRKKGASQSKSCTIPWCFCAKFSLEV